MRCVSPPALEELDLLAYLEGEAGEEIENHLRICNYCHHRAERLRRIQNVLRARLYRIDCPTPHELGEYHLGLLDRDRAKTVKAHLSRCPHCTYELAQLRQFLSTVEPEFEPSVAERVRILVAQLIDSTRSMQPGLAGLRGDVRGPLTYEVDNILIVLDVQSTSEGRVTILGQIAADDQDHWTDATVELRQNDVVQMMARIDDLGAFRCEDVLPNITDLFIKPIRGDAILVPNINIAV